MAKHRPEAVVRARSLETVRRTLAFAQRRRVPVTVRGGGVGYVGGCVPVQGGIVLALAGFNRIRELNPRDGVAIVEPGVITGELQKAAARRGWFYPPDPQSFDECTIGGNLATNAGGPRCLKYGVTRHYVLGLEVVLPGGEVARVGGRTHKNKTGFDLVGMFIGSEGLLGVITQATLRLIPHPRSKGCLSVVAVSLKKKAAAVEAILNGGFLPAALEIADHFTLEAVRRHVSKSGLPEGHSHLLIEVDGSPENVRSDLAALKRLLKKLRPTRILEAYRVPDAERLWHSRKYFSYSLRATGLTKLNEDVTVPRSRLLDLLRFAEGLKKKFGLEIACFGHAGDGNIHVNLMVDYRVRGTAARVDAALDELFRQVLEWGGVITGEHGIGLAKKPWWKQATSPEVRDLHRRLKRALDPQGVLNPGKFL
ncbi:MAG: FAD-binding protein [Verrucomicrobiae bacterium]|nr:FAD-binding protein [Verrucomicrobiae bacterium]